MKGLNLGPKLFADLELPGTVRSCRDNFHLFVAIANGSLAEIRRQANIQQLRCRNVWEPAAFDSL
jgi:hypothetical protein